MRRSSGEAGLTTGLMISSRGGSRRRMMIDAVAVVDDAEVFAVTVCDVDARGIALTHVPQRDSGPVLLRDNLS